MKTELTHAKEAREDLTRKLVKKDGEISHLQGEAREKSLIISGLRKKMSSTKNELEGFRQESSQKGEEIDCLKVEIKTLEEKYQSLLNKTDYENVLAFNLGYEKLKSDLLKDHSDLDLSKYNPSKVDENAEEEEEGVVEVEEDDGKGRAAQGGAQNTNQIISDDPALEEEDDRNS